ncbi:sn-glycerol-3-phosphate ABC transporter ATP-binding protein UgpC [Achromobacter xylosoxidans]|nr:sn-glycerol-3-phosphate ABC transporter ATP-binding protein UgpC [Achromobacter xylosoxidans]
MASLDIVNVHKRYGSVDILQDISIDIQDGEFLVLVGPSGCGKSTLMNIIAGLEPPTQGVLRLDGQDITQATPAERNISMVFQSYALYPHMTVAQNIEFPLRMRKVEKSVRAERVRAVSRLLQIEHLLARKPRQLSGGQRQRVAIGRALAREPRLYLLDEPLSNLDAQLRADMRTEIKRLHQRLQATIVYVTHDQIEAMTLATRIAVMNGGVLQQLGTPDDVYYRPANTFVARFVGAPRMNLVRARVALRAGQARLEFADGARPFSLPAPACAALRAYEGAEVIAGIRPEAVRLADPQDAAEDGAIDAGVDVVEPTGADTLVSLDLGGGGFTARLAPDVRLASGLRARFRIDTSRLICFDGRTETRIG